MVLEILINPKKATGKPWEMFFIGAIYSLFSMVLSYWVFRSHMSLVMIAFTAIAAVPFIHGAIESDERVDEIVDGGPFIKKHGKTIGMFLFMFIGYVTTFLIAFVVSSESFVATAFDAQISTIHAIRGTPTGNFLSYVSTFGVILLNNLRILLFCVIFSFFYGAGAIFILSWNASVMATAIGDAIRIGINRGGSYVGSVSSSLLGYFAHGLPEIAAFFIAGLAGGLISVVIMKEGIRSLAFKRVSKDAINLIMISAVTLAVAALIEVFISPRLL